MTKRILVPLDGSDIAEQVLPYVRILGKGLGVGVDLLRIFEPVALTLADPAHGLFLDRLVTSVRNHAEDYLGRVAASLESDGLTVSCTAREGSPAAQIMREAEAVPDTLLALCTHGRSGITRWVLGSTTEKVLHGTTQPVFVVRGRARQPHGAKIEPDTLVVPLDGSTLAEQVLAYGGALAKALELKVILVRVVPSLRDYALHFTEFGKYPFAQVQDLVKKMNAQAREYLDMVGDRLQEQGVVAVERRVLHGHPAGTIIDMAQEVENCLIAMTSHGDSGIDRWVRGSVVDRVMRYSENPVLVIRAVQESAPSRPPSGFSPGHASA
ncbi:MAG: universal stress protein [Candidatus Methylomirabilales bacterium]